MSFYNRLKEYLANREKEQKEDLEFPDEIDTPIDIAARVRFQKYRGLQSFRTSPWDPYENLPIDYARIYQFENYTRTKNRVIARSSTGGSKVKVSNFKNIYRYYIYCVCYEVLIFVFIITRWDRVLPYI